MTDVFISYVHEDARIVQFLAKILEANDVRVWLDKERLSPGLRWKMAIRDAIRNGTYFVSIHSKQRSQRQVSYVNEELTLAIEEIRKRPSSVTWFIPVLIDDSELEDRDIGGGETLGDLQYCDLTKWGPGLLQLLTALGVEEPKFDHGEPLAPGLPSVVEIANGFVRYDQLPGVPEVMQGLEFRVSGGWCQRMEDGGMFAYIETVAPMKKLQDFNVMAGLSGFHAVGPKGQISEDSESPTLFWYEREYILPKGLNAVDINTGTYIKLPMDFPIFTSFVADGFIRDSVFRGKFRALIESRHVMVPLKQVQEGEFELEFVPSFLRPH